MALGQTHRDPPAAATVAGHASGSSAGARLQAAGVLVFLSGATAAVAVRDPHASGSFGICPSLLLFGVYCPGCGALRGLHDLTHADLAGAVGHNLLLAPAILLLVLWAVFRLLPLRVGRAETALLKVQRRVNFPALVAVTLVGFALLRNIPGSPLAP